MEIRVEELGPLKDSSLGLGDLTVIHAPPGTGKSLIMKRIFGEYLPFNSILRKDVPVIVALHVLREALKNKVIEFDVNEVIVETRRKWLRRWIVEGEVEIHPSLEEFLEKVRGIRHRLTRETESYKLDVELDASVLSVALDFKKTNAKKSMEALKDITRTVAQAINNYLMTLENVSKDHGIVGVGYSSYGRSSAIQLYESLSHCIDSTPSLDKAITKTLQSSSWDPHEIIVGMSPPLLTVLEGTLYDMKEELEALLKASSLYKLIERSRESDAARGVSLMFKQLGAYIKKPSLFMIEEPEEELGPKGQSMMAVALYLFSGIYGRGFGSKLLVSTHSSVLALTLAYLSHLEAKPPETYQFLRNLGAECDDCLHGMEIPNVRIYTIEEDRIRELDHADVISRNESMVELPERLW